MHEHRRRDDSEEAQQGRLQRVAESGAAVAVSRLLTPALLSVCVGLLAFIGSGINKRFDDQAQVSAQQGRDIAEVKTGLQVVATRLDAQVIRQVDSNTQHIDKLEDRVQVLERSVSTP